MADPRSKTEERPLGAARAAVYWQGGDPRWQTGDLVPLTTTERADVCIVGGGFTGLWTALSVKRLAPGTDVIAALEDCSPGFGDAVLARQVLGPWDMESELGLVGGNVYGGELTIDQLFHLRPAPGFADYRSPVEGLYNGSAGAHGGGGVSGIPGWQAARQATRDARRRGARLRRASR